MTDQAPEKKRPHPQAGGLENGVTATTHPVARATPHPERPVLRDQVSGAQHARMYAMEHERLEDGLVQKDGVVPTPGKTRPGWVTLPFAPNVMRWSMLKWLSTNWRYRLMARL